MTVDFPEKQSEVAWGLYLRLEAERNPSWTVSSCVAWGKVGNRVGEVKRDESLIYFQWKLAFRGGDFDRIVSMWTRLKASISCSPKLLEKS